jgi:outer membrane protein assembly factor BamB
LDNNGIYIAGGSFMDDSTADAILLKYSVTGDSIYSIVYSLQPNVRDEFYSLAVDTDRDIYLTGVTTLTGNTKKMIFQKYSDTGQLIWLKDFNFKARGLKVILDNMDNPILAYDNWEGPAFAHLVINGFSPIGDSLWGVVFRDDTSAYGLGGLVRDDENNLYAGVLQLQIISGQHIYHSYVACIQNGSLDWFKYLGENNLRRIILDKENNIVLITQYESKLYKINSETGEIIWERDSNNSTNFIRNLYGLEIDEDNKIILTGNSSNVNANIQVQKFSTVGEEICVKEFESGSNDIPTAITTDHEKNIYLARSSVDSTWSASLLKLSESGELQWEYDVNQITYDHLFLYKIIVKDSSLFVGGDPYDSLTKSNILIMKLDQKSSTDVGNDNMLSTSYELKQNYPNPFNPSTIIKYSIPQPSKVVIKVFDIIGNEVVTLINEEKPVGNYRVEFNATGLPSGIYFYKLQAGNFVQTKKLVYLK